MFSNKTKLKLTDFECNLLINGMNEFRNMLLSDGIPTDDVLNSAVVYKDKIELVFNYREGTETVPFDILVKENPRLCRGVQKKL